MNVALTSEKNKFTLCGINASAITFDHAKLRAENSQI